MRTRLLLLVILLSLGGLLSASKLQEDYISMYRDVAIREMKKFRIPASITLAQGLLESGSGTSYLAVKANNHFGIKCHQDWRGKKVYADDDRRNECFRAYKHAEESFRDHSHFLSNRSRYASLFEEDITDYKAWARGLKKAGYATNRRYADLLIDLIERYDLHQYDDPNYQAVQKSTEKIEVKAISFKTFISPNRVKYVVAQEGEDIYDIAIKTDRWPGELQRYNEITEEDRIKAGQKIYLQPKRKKAAKEQSTHTVQEGETIHSIAQQYAIRTQHLRRRNGLSKGQEVKPGDVLKLR
jgi:LysM repeat protein